MARKPHLLLITTGGTFGMLPGGREFLRNVLEAVPEVRRLATLRTVSPFTLDSSSMTPAHWVSLGALIAREMSRVDGFVVTHGTDTMAFTAAALSFMLENLRKPVVLTGAQRPLAEIRNDARANLVDAVEVAAAGIPEVVVCFGGLVLRGNRARKWSLTDYRAFHSPNFPPLAEVGARLAVRDGAARHPRGRFRFRPAIDPRVLHLQLVPGRFGSNLHGLDLRGTRGVVLETFGAGNVPVFEDGGAVPFLRLRRSGVTVFVVSSAEHGTVDLSLYEGGRNAAAGGAVPARDMTSEAAVVKLMVALGRGRNAREVRRILETDLAGEVTL